MLGGQIKDPISVLVVFLLLLLLLVEPKLVFIKLLASLPPPSPSPSKAVYVCVSGGIFVVSIFLSSFPSTLLFPIFSLLFYMHHSPWLSLR